MVAYSEFVAEIKRERAYFEAGGSSWRRQVASISEYIVIQSPFRSLEYFCNKDDVVALVKDLTPGLNNDELVEDIGQFLIHIACSLTANLPTEVTEYVEMQRQKRAGKPLSFKDKIIVPGGEQMDIDGELIPLAKGQKIRFNDIQAFPEKTEIINGELLWSDEEKKAVILGVLTNVGLSYLVSVLPKHSLEELRYIVCVAKRETSNEIEEEVD